MNKSVQHECIPQAILGGDVLCQAKSGMGKTAVFTISVLQQLELEDGKVSALIMCHTRELAYQVAHEFGRFSTHFSPAVRVGVFYGGSPESENRKLLSSKETCPHVVVGTPGRVKGVRACFCVRSRRNLLKRGPMRADHSTCFFVLCF